MTNMPQLSNRAQQALDMTEEQVALDLAENLGRAAAFIEWCISHDGECLADHPSVLSRGRDILAACLEIMQLDD